MKFLATGWLPLAMRFYRHDLITATTQTAIKSARIIRHVTKKICGSLMTTLVLIFESLTQDVFRFYFPRPVFIQILQKKTLISNVFHMFTKFSPMIHFYILFRFFKNYKNALCSLASTPLKKMLLRTYCVLQDDPDNI